METFSFLPCGQPDGLSSLPEKFTSNSVSSYLSGVDFAEFITFL